MVPLVVESEPYRYHGTFCGNCGKPRKLHHADMCKPCHSRLQSMIDANSAAHKPRTALDEFDASVGHMRGMQHRTEEASERIHKAKHNGSASLADYYAAGPVALSPEGQREALALGLVPYKTSGQDAPKTGRVSIEIDPLLARAQRLKKSVITSARLHNDEAKATGFRGAWYMLTLTYRDGCNSGPRDISDLLRAMRGHFNVTRSRAKRFAGQVFRYLWVGELTQRGIPHYHILIWIPQGMYFGKIDKRGWWPHGCTNMKKARNAVGYLAKYASKFTSLVAGQFPKGFRTHGCGGLNQESKRELRYWKAPVSAREILGVAADIRKALGGWFDKLTGEFWPSPWRVTIFGGRIIAWKVIEL